MIDAKRWIRQAKPVLPGIVAALCSMGLWGLGGWNAIEQLGYSSLFRLREQLQQLPPTLRPHNGWDDRIAVIAIDEKSLQQYGRFPWSRDRYVELLDQLAFVQPAVVSFDILFVEPTEDDPALATAIADSGGHVVLAVESNYDSQNFGLSSILTVQAEGAFESGHVKSVPDSDGISRQAWLREGGFPSLGVATVEMYASSLAHTFTPDSNNSIDLHTLLPADTNHSYAWLNWPGPIHAEPTHAEPLNAEPIQLEKNGHSSGALQVVSFVDVMDGTIDLDSFQNKIVLVGVTAAGLDPARSPLNYDPPIAGVYYHAAIVDNLLNDRFLHRANAWTTVAIILGMGVGTSVLLSSYTLHGRLILMIGLPLAWVGVGLLCFLGQWWIPLASPIVTVVMTLIGVQWQEQQEKQQMMSLFSMHVAPQTAQVIWSRRDELLTGGQLQPQELTATVLFMDIRGFTAISEQMPSSELVSWLNRYFEVMTDCIMEHGGVVDKYIGDAIMAVFGIPFPRTQLADIRQDAIAAIATSIEMCDRLQSLNADLTRMGQPTISVGIGVHTGVLTVGSVGSRRRVNYSVFGDTVNTAARLESMTKMLPTETAYKLLMSEQTFNHVSDEYPGKSFGSIKLRGRQAKTITYTLTPQTHNAAA